MKALLLMRLREEEHIELCADPILSANHQKSAGRRRRALGVYIAEPDKNLYASIIETSGVRLTVHYPVSGE